MDVVSQVSIYTRHPRIHILNDGFIEHIHISEDTLIPEEDKWEVSLHSLA